MNVHLQIFKNKIVLLKGTETVTVNAALPFSTERLLVGNFDSAWSCIQEAGEQMHTRGLFKPRPIVVVEPKEIIDGGVSQIEERVFRELAMALNPKSVEVLV